VIGSSDHNSDKTFTFTNYSDGDVFHGYASNLIVYDGALSRDELGTLHRQMVEEASRLATNKVREQPKASNETGE